uniref:Protein kinase domain-containing protein n=1 Tax=Meloidogyne enterolobii TaxID=390850 RepID=A0A6V7X6Z0_MELEN|nr:unnamed protein product [Meloidogyne enterolobii]
MKNRMFVKEKYDGIELKFIRDDDIGSGGYGRILHAYWERENEAECVALKDILMYSDERIKFALNEVNVLNEVMEFPDEQRDHIITMHGSEEKTIGGNRHMYIILELGGIDLEVYYNKMRRNKDLVLLNILKCAARGLQQFHEIGIHLDIKAKNFVIPLDQDLNSPLKSCKLIDFSFSIITQQEPVEIELYGTNKYAPPEFINTKLATRKNDIFAFGVMTYKFLKAPNADNFSVNKRLLGNSRIDRVAKVCMEKEADNRPSVKALNDFLNGNCDRFISEQNEYGKLCEN